MGGMARDCDAGHEPKVCDAALARAFGFLGKRWNGVLLGTLITGPAGFSELKRAISGISDSMLSERLAELCRAGLVQRSVDEGPPIAVGYTLTPAGLALLPGPSSPTATCSRSPAGMIWRCADVRVYSRIK